MYNHAPKDYECPICLAIAGIENDKTLIKQADIVYKDNLATALISSFITGGIAGHVIVVPNQHFENIYDLPEEYANRIASIAKRVALAMKQTYQCEGITTLQNNEPAGNQHAFHYHFHIFPRFANDNLRARLTEKAPALPEKRLVYARKLKGLLEFDN